MTPERLAELKRECEYRHGTFWEDMRALIEEIERLWGKEK